MMCLARSRCPCLGELLYEDSDIVSVAISNLAKDMAHCREPFRHIFTISLLGSFYMVLIDCIERSVSK